MRRFFRTIVVAEDLDAFPNAAEFPAQPQPPEWLVSRTLPLDYELFTDEVLFESATHGRSVRDEGAFTYEWEPQRRKLVLRWNSVSLGVEEILLRPGTWWEFSGAFTSKFTAADGVESKMKGTFALTPDLPLFP